MDSDHASKITAFLDHQTGFIHMRDADGNVIAEIFRGDNGDSILRHATGETICSFQHLGDGSQLIVGAGGEQWGTLSNDVFGDSVFHDMQDGSYQMAETGMVTADGSMGHVHDSMGAHLADVQLHDVGEFTSVDVTYDQPDLSGWDDLL